MRSTPRSWWAVATLVLTGGLSAQEKSPTPPAPAAAPAAVAATCNGQAIPEVAVLRGLKRVPPDRQAEARADILNYLIDTALVDQYLAQFKIDVPAAEVEARHSQINGEIKKQGGSVEKVMQELSLTEA